MKTMATPGEVEYKYRRTYVCVNPDAGLGPPTWRLAVSQEIGDGGGGGTPGAGTLYDFDGVAPINVKTTPGGGRTKVETSIDIQQLDNRAD